MRQIQDHIAVSFYDDRPFNRNRVTALLGPTNTGKTHYAIERLLAHKSGIIGFPLRLLAREIYDRLCRIKNPAELALITGEEKIIPTTARYFICTIESMPVDRPVSFVAVDEIQLIADRERGHVFTNRLLHARGEAETLFLGAETVRPLMVRLISGIEFINRPRLSVLRYAGAQKLTRLPRRTAIVAFSANEVYALAEQVRRQRGGVALVMGALSPRVRNAQVALYQNGAVDYLVATDAIGMGLNMDVDHVAFAQNWKFDGKRRRSLSMAEIGQIAGRAGRYLADGSFGTTGPASKLTAETVQAVEQHHYHPLRSCQWRNQALEFRSSQALLRSLEQPAPKSFLRRTDDAEDHQVLAGLIRGQTQTIKAQGEEAVRLLWEVCQTPDFRKTLAESHIQLVATLYQYLSGPGQCLPENWISEQLRRLDQREGSIDILIGRLAHIRTWSYIAHRGDWLTDPEHWQGLAGQLEDQLSDALHERLTNRFVDPCLSFLTRRLDCQTDLLGSVDRNGLVKVEGYAVGYLTGFSFKPEAAFAQTDTHAVIAAARRALTQEISARFARCMAADLSAFALSDCGSVLWQGEKIAKLVAGETILMPALTSLRDDWLDGTQQTQLRQKIIRFVVDEIAARLHPLNNLRQKLADGYEASGDKPLTGAARGLIYRLYEGLGNLPLTEIQDPLQALTRADRRSLKKMGVVIGSANLFMPALLKPESMALRARLWTIAHPDQYRQHQEKPSLLIFPTHKSSIPAKNHMPDGLYKAAGYRRVGPRWLRVDLHDRLVAVIRRNAGTGSFVMTQEMQALAGCRRNEMEKVLLALGYRRAVSSPIMPPTESNGFQHLLLNKDENAAAMLEPIPTFSPVAVHKYRHKKRKHTKSVQKIDPFSPFAKLHELQLRF